MKLKFLFFFIFSIVLFGNCQDKKTYFDEGFKKELFEKLNAKGKTSFSYKNLSDLFALASINEIYEGHKVEKEFKFEDFDCECREK